MSETHTLEPVAVNRRPTDGVVFTDDLNPVDAIIARGLLRD